MFSPVFYKKQKTKILVLTGNQIKTFLDSYDEAKDIQEGRQCGGSDLVLRVRVRV